MMLDMLSLEFAKINNEKNLTKANLRGVKGRPKGVALPCNRNRENGQLQPPTEETSTGKKCQLQALTEEVP